MKRCLETCVTVVLLLSSLVACTRVHAITVEQEWPLEIESGGTRIVLYQPQPESFHDDKVTARAAVSVERTGDPEPQFGAIWIEARVATDRDARTVTVLDMQVPRVRFPGATSAEEAELVAVLQREVPKQRHTFSLDRLLATLDRAVEQRNAGSGISFAPPRIVFTTVPTVLVTLDGEPKLEAIEGARVLRVVNTPFLMLFHPDEKRYYLKAGDAWAIASDVEQNWRKVSNPPSEIVSAVPPPAVERQSAVSSERRIGDERILAVTEPTELIVSDGEPQWTPIEGNELLYLENSASDVFMEVATQRYFVLLSGRWYASSSLDDDGRWTHVPADALPPAFAAIGTASPKRAVRAFVAGTDEAQDAILDASIPQTAAIRRDAVCRVTYDGEPSFARIDGTRLRYAVNTSDSVLELDGRYYCCQDAVWFVSDTPHGPWAAAPQVPQEIYAIPPKSPVYPVTYVHVYDSTPDVVYVGYLPGYLGCYVAGPTIVYGTGWWYPGWYGSTYFAHPWTWGFGAHYDPWSCAWGFGHGWHGWSVHVGWFSHSYGFGHPGWWGHGGFHNDVIDIRDDMIRVRRRSLSDRAFTRDDVGHQNVYRRGSTIARNAPLVRSAPAASRTSVPSRLSNDLYVDPEGNVLRRTSDGWLERNGDGWQPAQPVQPLPLDPGARAPGAQRPAPIAPRVELDRMDRARQHGGARASTYQRKRTVPVRPPAPPPRPPARPPAPPPGRPPRG